MKKYLLSKQTNKQKIEEEEEEEKRIKFLK